MAPSGSQLLLLLLCPVLSRALVTPPTNVTLTCHNFQNILNWDHDAVVPGVRFKVTIGSNVDLKSCEKEIWVDQPPLQVNVSFLSDPDSVNFLAVTAVVGGNESAPSPETEVIFTYFYNSLDGHKCLLDLPPVTVTPLENHHIHLQFQHPWLVYKFGLSTCKKRKHSRLPDFHYTVRMHGKDHSQRCEEKVCEMELQANPKLDKHCLKINGRLEKMFVESTQEYCSPKPPSHIHLMVWISIGAVLAVVLLVTFMVYWKKTTPLLRVPHTLVFPRVKKEAVFKPLDDHPSPVKSITLLIGPVVAEEEFVTPIDPESESYEEHMKLSPTNNQIHHEDLEGGISTGEGSAYIDGRDRGEDCGEDDEEPKSNEDSHCSYERRPVVELAPEDRAEGYRG